MMAFLEGSGQGLLHNDVLMKLIWVFHIIYSSPWSAWTPSHVNSFPFEDDIFMKSIGLRSVYGVYLQ